MQPFDAKSATVASLFATYRAILRELRDRGIVRTANAPAGDYAEYLCRRALGGELAPNSEPSFDLKTADGRRVQVKCRVDDDTGKNRRVQLSPFRTFGFDHAAVLLLRPDYTVRRAVLVPRAHVESVAVSRRRADEQADRAAARRHRPYGEVPGDTDLREA